AAAWLGRRGGSKIQFRVASEADRLYLDNRGIWFEFRCKRKDTCRYFGGKSARQGWRRAMDRVRAMVESDPAAWRDLWPGPRHARSGSGRQAATRGRFRHGQPDPR